MECPQELQAHLYLARKGVRPSLQRMAVMEYLWANRTHPTVDEIYGALQRGIPTLSKTTVYNTLKLLEEKGAVQALTLEEKNLRFDGDTRPHAHFLCKGCGRIVDLFLPHTEALTQVCQEGLQDMDLHSAQLYYRGYCPHCRGQNKTSTEE